MHLGRRPAEPVDRGCGVLRPAAGGACGGPRSATATWRLLECRPAWDGNPTWEHFLAFAWEARTAACWSPSTTGHAGPVLRPAALADLRPEVCLRDLLDSWPRRPRRHGLLDAGLYLDLPAAGYHVFEVMPARGRPLTSRRLDPRQAYGPALRPPDRDRLIAETTAGTALRESGGVVDRSGRPPRGDDAPAPDPPGRVGGPGRVARPVHDPPAVRPGRGPDAAGGGGADGTGGGRDQAPGLPGSPVRRGLVGPPRRGPLPDGRFLGPSEVHSAPRDGSIFLTLAGQVRERMEYFNRFQFGSSEPAQSDAYLLSRIMFSADLHVTRYFRLFAEARARSPPTAISRGETATPSSTSSLSRTPCSTSSSRSETAPASPCGAAARSSSSAPSVW